MLARGRVVILALMVMLSVLSELRTTEGRAVPHHRRRGERITRLHNVTLSNATMAVPPGTELILEGYRMNRFGRELFDMLAHTGSLTLRKGAIANVFFHSHTLDTLQIEATGLETFDLDALPLANLRVLQITKNELERISPRIGYLVGLRQLDLSRNHLTHVSLELFEPMEHLRDLDLSVNRIVRVEAPEGLRLTVRNLWVGYNRLQTFDVFPAAFPTLATVRLNGNAWSCPWVEWARGEIFRQGITVFGADYDCTGDRRGGLCCYEATQPTPTEELPRETGRVMTLENEGNGTIGVQFGAVEIFF